jgi:hypothetical protein
MREPMPRRLRRFTDVHVIHVDDLVDPTLRQMKKLEFTVGPFKVWAPAIPRDTNRLCVLEGNIFDVQLPLTGRFGGVWDTASLVALAPADREVRAILRTSRCAGVAP